MALIHKAEIRPTKLELLEAWLPSRPWASGGERVGLERVGAYRFDDPAGEVGIETLLVRHPAGPVLQVPLTYRGAPLASAESSLITTMEHSVLGERWVYDGCGDPAYVQAVLTAILTGGMQAREVIEVAGTLVGRDSPTRVRGTGSPETPVPGVDADTLTSRDDGTRTIIDAGWATLTVRRVLDPAHQDLQNAHRLVGRWPGQDADALLADVSAR